MKIKLTHFVDSAMEPTVRGNYVLFLRGWLSQWFPCTFKDDSHAYNCAEQYMMAEKARFFGDETTRNLIMRSISPKAQKELGRTVFPFNEEMWQGVCQQIVYQGNLLKFSQNPALKDKLLATGTRIIAEASSRDKIWGIGLDETHRDATNQAKWRGTNWLGIALMKVRETLRTKDNSHGR